MNAALYLTGRYLRARPLPALLLVLAFALTAALPWVTHRLAGDFERALTARARSTPLIVGPPGSRFDLTLATLYFRPTNLSPLSLADVQSLAAEAGLLAVPINTQYTARGARLVATAREYFEQRGLWPATGRWPNWVGECVLGSQLAQRLQLTTGDHLVSDTDQLLDLAKSPALELEVVGILAPSNSPDDEVLFAELQSAWVVAGLAHAHQDPGSGLEPGQLLGRTTETLVLSGAFVPDRSLNAGNRPDYHLHAGPEALPVTAILLFPRDEKARTLIETRLNIRGPNQAIRPEAVVEELLGTVLRLRRLIDGIALLMAGLTLGLALAVGRLGIELRAEESQTLRRLGAGRRIAWRLHGSYWSLILLAALLLAYLLVQATLAWFRDPTQLL